MTQLAYILLSLLKSHQRQHNKDKPFKCSNCYRAYSDSASLQIHLSAHAIKNAKAYCCSMCGRAYTSVSWKCTSSYILKSEFTTVVMCKSGGFFLLFFRKHTLWSTWLNTQWWNMWCPITPPSTGQSHPPFLYVSPSSEVLVHPFPPHGSYDIG